MAKETLKKEVVVEKKAEEKKPNEAYKGSEHTVVIKDPARDY